jgi:hypothetical protein
MGKTLRPDLQAEGFSPSTGDTIEFKRPTIERVLASMHERFNDPTKVARLNADYQAYVSRVNWPRYEVVGRHGVWEADQGIKWRPSAPSVTTAVVLDSPPPTATLRELPTFFGPQCDATWPVVTTREILDTEAPQVVTRELTEGALQKVTLELSGMPESYYGVVKGRTVANLLGVSFWDSRETLTPWFPEPEYQGLNQINHRDLTRLTSLRDRVGGILKQMDLGERASASKLTIDQFIKAYMVPKSL